MGIRKGKGDREVRKRKGRGIEIRDGKMKWGEES